MRKITLITIIFLLALTASADDAKNKESKRRIDHICELYNQDLNDSLIHQAPIDMQYHKEHQCWEHYYETWMHLVNTYVFMGKVNTGLKEVKLMHDDATERNNKYGLALANYAMGNAYNNMGYLDEAVSRYKQSLALIADIDTNTTIGNDIFSYYCDALNELKQYGAMGSITQRWRKYLDNLTKDDTPANKKSSDVWYAYYYLACAQQHLGLDKLDEAEAYINEAEAHTKDQSDFLPMSIIYYRAQLYLQRKDYNKAWEYNTQRLKKSLGYDDKSSMVLIYEQRAKILKGLGQYEEAAEMYKNVYELTDSIYKKDARTQINELNTLFHVSELDMEQRLQRNRNITTIAIIIAIALALLVGYWFWMSRRLRRKNEELAIARDQAQESLRMKSDFIKNISHEIRTPLNILSGFSQIMAQTGAELPADIRQEASIKIQENTDRITSLINRLLALSESSSRNHIERADDIRANQLCTAAISESKVADTNRHQFIFESSVSDMLTLKTSEQYAVQALSHLLDNAMKFTPQGGTIRMQCRTEAGQLVVSVEDTGCGVPKEKADDIFVEFVQLDEFKDGVGIGLPLSRNIARRLEGDIVLDTTYTDGARFVFTLPL